MNTYREAHQQGRHDHRLAVHGEIHEPLSAEDLQLAKEKLANLQRQLKIGSNLRVGAAIEAIYQTCFHLLIRTDDGNTPEVVIDLKATYEEAKRNYLR